MAAMEPPAAGGPRALVLHSGKGRLLSRTESAGVLRGVFRRADRNGDGTLSRTELIVRLREDGELARLLRLPQRVGDADRGAFEAVFQGMDEDTSRGVSEQEFVSYFLRRREAHPSARAAEKAVAAQRQLGNGRLQIEDEPAAEEEEEPEDEDKEELEDDDGERYQDPPGTTAFRRGDAILLRVHNETGGLEAARGTVLSTRPTMTDPSTGLQHFIQLHGCDRVLSFRIECMERDPNRARPRRKSGDPKPWCCRVGLCSPLDQVNLHEQTFQTPNRSQAADFPFSRCRWAKRAGRSG